MSNVFRLSMKDGSHVADVPVGSFGNKQPDAVIYSGKVYMFHTASPAGGDPASAEYREATTLLIPTNAPVTPTQPAPGFHKVTEPGSSEPHPAEQAKPAAPAAQKK